MFIFVVNDGDVNNDIVVFVFNFVNFFHIVVFGFVVVVVDDFIVFV